MKTIEKFKEPCETYYTVFSNKKDPSYKYNNLSPFEFKNILIKEASKKNNKILNAGRGNPNFFSVLPRKAFSLLSIICTSIGDSLSEDKDIGFIPEENGIYNIFMSHLSVMMETETARFLDKAIDNMIYLSGFPKDKLVHQLVISTLGCFYPSPPRIQQFVQPIIENFVKKNIYNLSHKNSDFKFDIFPTEGASSAIIYVFNSLTHNKIISNNDIIGILTPIFSPYLEIPNLGDYNFKQVCIQSKQTSDWDISDKELEKISNPKMKALFLCNPANPTSVSLSYKTINKIASIVKKYNPNLIILSDNVYAPFVDNFNSFIDILPFNTIGIYSFSKYFGTTGWRLGTIILNENNIIDSSLLKNLPSEKLKTVNKRYSIISTNPSSLPFIERLVLDSRRVAEGHTAGLSTPQQVIMSLFAIHDNLDVDRTYNKRIKRILSKRMNNLITPIKYNVKESDINSNYYIIIDILQVSINLFNNSKFTNHLKNNTDPLNFLLDLAKNYSTVLLSAVGFAGPFWGVRVSLANLSDDDYIIIGNNIKKLLYDYYNNFFLFNYNK